PGGFAAGSCPLEWCLGCFRDCSQRRGVLLAGAPTGSGILYSLLTGEIPFRRQRLRLLGGYRRHLSSSPVSTQGALLGCAGSVGDARRVHCHGSRASRAPRLGALYVWGLALFCWHETPLQQENAGYPAGTQSGLTIGTENTAGLRELRRRP